MDDDASFSAVIWLDSGQVFAFVLPVAWKAGPFVDRERAALADRLSRLAEKKPAQLP
jgi:hypothetical protein